MLSIPLPFTLATLALGKPVDATHAAGVVLLVIFTHAVRLLHYQARLPIVAAIAVSALAYCLAGSGLASVLPTSDAAFWGVSAGAFLFGALLVWLMPRRDEPGHRSPLPLYVKLPAIAAVILALILIKQMLSGFMTVFPMVGVITAYEARYSLRAVCRQIHIFVLAFIPMAAAIRLMQDALGLAGALPLGWLVFFAILAPLTWRAWFGSRSSENAQMEPAPER